MIRFIKETRAKGAIPILFLSIVRINCYENGVSTPTHGDYTLETRLVAQEFNVTFIDMEYFSELLEHSYGPEKSKQLHLHFKEDKTDNTPICKIIATAIAKIPVEEFKKKLN